jgi:hypothetical protein
MACRRLIRLTTQRRLLTTPHHWQGFEDLSGGPVITRRSIRRKHSGSIALSGSRWRASVTITAVAALLLALLVAPADSAGARQIEADRFKAKDNLSVAGTVNGAKSATSRMAQTDRSLLGVRSSEAVNVVVKLDYDSTVARPGTSPTGRSSTTPRRPPRPEPRFQSSRRASS